MVFQNIWKIFKLYDYIIETERVEENTEKEQFE